MISTHDLRIKKGQRMSSRGKKIKARNEKFRQRVANHLKQSREIEEWANTAINELAEKLQLKEPGQ